MKRTGRVYPQVSVDSSPCRAVGQELRELKRRNRLLEQKRAGR